MKARVKATGDIIEISEDCSYLYAENYDKSYNLNELEFLDVKEKSLPKDDPDYWEKLKHQYAGMAMQGILSNPDIELDFEGTEACVQASIKLATALIDKLKEESQCEK